MLLRHTAFNLMGLGIPLLVAVASIPPLITALGMERFGLLTLIWAVVSYFGLFDLGLGRALTQQLAVSFASQDHSRAGALIGTAILLMGTLGVVVGGIMAVAAPWGVGLIGGVPDQAETVMAVYAMAFTIPAIFLTSGFRGVLEARRAFGILNLIRLPMGLVTYLGPLAVVFYLQPRLDWIAWVLAAGRMAGCVAHAYYGWRLLPSNTRVLVTPDLIKPLCVAGGWLTVSNVVGQSIGYVDRFMVAAIVSTSAVAYYATPQELVTKLSIVPGAMTAVLFPAFAAQMVPRDQQNWALFKKALHWLFVALLPVTVALSFYSFEFLTLWIGTEFATHSATLLQIFAIGMFVNCLGTVPFTFIQGVGASRIAALIHCAELPLYIGALWILTSSYGVMGAAVAWLLRISSDAVLMFFWSTKLSDRSFHELLNHRIGLLIFMSALAFYGALVAEGSFRILWMFSVPVAIGISFLRHFDRA